MATNQTGIALSIKAWLPMPSKISDQIATLQAVEAAHASGDYTALLNSAKVEGVKAEQKTRRMEDAPAPTPAVEPVTAEVMPDEAAAAEQAEEVAAEAEATPPTAASLPAKARRQAA